MKKINVYSMLQIRESSKVYDIETNVINSPENVVEIMNKVFNLSAQDREHLCVLTLTSKSKVAGAHIISIGSLNSGISHPREIFKAAILNNAASIILCHNHPSGDPAPSPEDEKITHKLFAAGKILSIPVLDHVIIGGDNYYSFGKKNALT